MGLAAKDVFQLAKAVDLPSRFPNLAEFERLFARGTSRFSESESARALFSNFRPFFENGWTSSFGRASDSIDFCDFGFGSTKDFQSYAAKVDGSLESTILTSSRGERFGFAAPASTFQFWLDLQLGYDAERLCDAASRKNSLFYSGKTTALERAVLQPELRRLGGLFPFAAFDSNADSERQWTSSPLAALRETLKQGLGESVSVYWESRRCVISGRPLLWTLFFPFEPNATRSAKTERSDVSISVGVNDGNSGPEDRSARKTPKMTEKSSSTHMAQCVDGTLDERDPGGNKTVEFLVDVGTGETSREQWNALAPGSILTTNASAQDLFTAFLNGQPFARVKPGVYRGRPAAQIKEFLSDDK